MMNEIMVCVGQRPAGPRGTAVAVTDAVAGRCEVMLDSGVRSGLDVLKAVALGATGAMLGRPALWGLAAGGAAGVADVLALLCEEFRHAMTLAGCPDLAAVSALRTVTRS